MDLAEAEFYNNNGGDTEENRLYWEERQKEETEEFVNAVLHKCGYTVFSKPHLTIWERNSIISGWAELEKKIHGAK